MLTGLAAIALLAISFLDWFEVKGAVGPGASANMWEAFSVVDIVVALAIATTLATAVAALVAYESGLPVAGSALTALTAMIAFLLVAIRMVDPPGDDLSREVGAWLGLVAIAAIVVGSFRGMREERPPRIRRS